MSTHPRARQPGRVPFRGPRLQVRRGRRVDTSRTSRAASSSSSPVDRLFPRCATAFDPGLSTPQFLDIPRTSRAHRHRSPCRDYWVSQRVSRAPTRRWRVGTGATRDRRMPAAPRARGRRLFSRDGKSKLIIPSVRPRPPERLSPNAKPTTTLNIILAPSRRRPDADAWALLLDTAASLPGHRSTCSSARTRGAHPRAPPEFCPGGHPRHRDRLLGRQARHRCRGGRPDSLRRLPTADGGRSYSSTTWCCARRRHHGALSATGAVPGPVTRRVSGRVPASWGIRLSSPSPRSWHELARTPAEPGVTGAAAASARAIARLDGAPRLALCGQLRGERARAPLCRRGDRADAGRWCRGPGRPGGVGRRARRSPRPSARWGRCATGQQPPPPSAGWATWVDSRGDLAAASSTSTRGSAASSRPGAGAMSNQARGAGRRSIVNISSGIGAGGSAPDYVTLRRDQVAGELLHIGLARELSQERASGSTRCARPLQPQPRFRTSPRGRAARGSIIAGSIAPMRACADPTRIAAGGLCGLLSDASILCHRREPLAGHRGRYPERIGIPLPTTR